jgi:hypothetical protein
MPKENLQQDLPITEDASKNTTQEEKSTADSPPRQLLRRLIKVLQRSK